MIDHVTAIPPVPNHFGPCYYYQFHYSHDLTMLMNAGATACDCLDSRA